MDLFGNKDRQIQELQNQIYQLQQQVHPDITTLNYIREESNRWYDAINQQQYTYNQNVGILSNLEATINQKQQELLILENELMRTNEELMLQSYGIYVPTYKLMASETYKNDMKRVREAEKELIKNDKATTSINTWTINGSQKEGTKLVKDTTKLLLKSFNLECDDIIDKINASNYNQSLKRIDKAAEQISKLGTVMRISITEQYVNFKKNEAVIAFNYALAKQAEKEELARVREEIREKEKIKKEMEAKKKTIEKEEQHYNKAIESLEKEIIKYQNDYAALKELLERKQELNEALTEVQTQKNTIDFRDAHPKAGYVYIISNIGSFGENVYKIGCTRRLEPIDRVDELGGASVPFKFDVHALIFSEDAFALEAALHNAFADRKVNLENARKEFFNVTLDEIKRVVYANYDKTVDFIDIAEAAEYRATLKKKEMMRQGIKFDF